MRRGRYSRLILIGTKTSCSGLGLIRLGWRFDYFPLRGRGTDSPFSFPLFYANTKPSFDSHYAKLSRGIHKHVCSGRRRVSIVLRFSRRFRFNALLYQMIGPRQCGTMGGHFTIVYFRVRKIQCLDFLNSALIIVHVTL